MYRHTAVTDKARFLPAHILYVYYPQLIWACSSVVVKALRYLSDGPGINCRWCHWGFFPWLPPAEPWALGSNQPLKMSTRVFSWGKGCRYVRLTTYHPFSAETSRKSGTRWATSACCGITFTFIIIGV